jgi:hypothetical protein
MAIVTVIFLNILLVSLLVLILLYILLILLFWPLLLHKDLSALKCVADLRSGTGLSIDLGRLPMRQ